MSKLAERLRAMRLVNNYDLLKRFGASGDVAIEYSRREQGRLGWCQSNHTSVWSPFRHKKLPEDGIHLPTKKFIGNRAASFQLATNWAMEEFGHDYVPSPFGGRIPDHVLYKAMRALNGTEQKQAMPLLEGKNVKEV